MDKISKIYTKTGDQGTTSLVNGDRVHKSDLRLECYGTVDELNSHIGVLVSHLQSYAFDQSVRMLTRIQNQLFNLGSQLACPDQKISASLPQIETQHITDLEKEMDAMMQVLPPLKEFILPGGNILASQTHVVRTVCRRAERLCCTLSQEQKISETIIPYLNRLNDYFFVLARYFNHHLGFPETTWKK